MARDTQIVHCYRTDPTFNESTSFDVRLRRIQLRPTLESIEIPHLCHLHPSLASNELGAHWVLGLTNANGEFTDATTSGAKSLHFFPDDKQERDSLNNMVFGLESKGISALSFAPHIQATYPVFQP